MVVRPPLRVIASKGWSLKEWLVPLNTEVHYNQRVAVLRSAETGAVDHALAPHAGMLTRRFLEEGASVPLSQDDKKGPPLAEIKYCPHSVVFSGLCAVCGDDVSSGHFAEIVPAESHRLPVAYDAKTLTITRAEAESAASVTCANLLRSRKLSLVLDLDHTLVHASDDMRAVAVLDFSPPGADVDSVKSFSLGPTAPLRHRSRASSRCNMFVKLRPHLKKVLERLSKLFELSIYTMGSRPYANQVVRIIDPGDKLFRGRVTSREDFQEGKLNQKSLERLFPCDNSMVLIVDDREDVWISGTGEFFMPNLVRAKPYYFWNGLSEVYDRASGSMSSASGQIPNPRVTPVNTAEPTKRDLSHKQLPNSKQIYIGALTEEPLTGTHLSTTKEPLSNPSETASKVIENGSKQTKDKCLSHLNGIEESKELSNGHNNKIGTVVNDVQHTNGTDKPQAKGSAPLESKEETNCKDPQSSLFNHETEAFSSNHTNDTVRSKHEANEAKILFDENVIRRENGIVEGINGRFEAEMRTLVEQWWEADSNSDFSDHLLRLADVLENAHKIFFEQMDSASPSKKRNGILKGNELMSSEKETNVKDILAYMRRSVFEGCIFTFTGVFPLGTVPEETVLWNFAERHGAICSNLFESGVTTHVIASPTRGACTEKTKRAVLENTSFCVTTSWLEDSMLSWERLPELTYSIHPPCNHTNWKEFRKEVDSCRAVKYAELARDNPERFPVDRIANLKKRQLHSDISFSQFAKRRKLAGSEDSVIAIVTEERVNGDSVHVRGEELPTNSRVLTADEINDALDELI